MPKAPKQEIATEARPLFTIAVASELTGVGAVMIREYEKSGLIAPRRVHGKRRFSQCDVANIRLIRYYLQDQQMTLHGLRLLFQMAPCYKVRFCETTTCPLYGKSGRNCWEVAESAKACLSDYCASCPVFLANSGKPRSEPMPPPAPRAFRGS